MTTPSVSVIVPAYQAEPYLDASLASIAGQTHPPDEVVVIDDASNDATGAIAERWSEFLPINLVTKVANGGLGAARATGIEASSGELIALLDSDDIWFPDHLAVMTEQYERTPGIVTAANYRWWPGHRVDTIPSCDLNKIPEAGEQRLEILRRNFVFVCTLFARQAHDDVGGFSDRRKDEDWDLWIRMIRAGAVVSTPGVVTVLYRQRLDSLSGEDGCLDDDIDLLASLQDLRDDESNTVRSTLRHLRARRELLDGYALARDGHVGDARKLWLRAAVRDRSLRLGPGQSGSTSLRAIACAISPKRVVGLRDQRRVTASDR